MTSWGETQLLIVRDFQEHVVPHYTKPYPPSRDAYYGFLDGNRLTYERYARAIESGRAIARPIHGCMHAARVTLYSALLSQLYRRAGYAVGRLYSLQMAAAFHDAARQDEGIDQWDAKSAKLAAVWLEARGSTREAAKFRHWLTNKNSPRPLALAHTILHDADALDIQRIAHIRARFRPERLWLCDPKLGIPIRDKVQLVTDIGRFIDYTEPIEVKRELESSADYYVQVMHILTAAHRGTGQLPLLHALLMEVLDS